VRAFQRLEWEEDITQSLGMMHCFSILPAQEDEPRGPEKIIEGLRVWLGY
jgi:hypothetical protein